MARSYKHKLEEAVLDLVLQATGLGVSVEVRDPRMQPSFDLWGYFECTENLIVIFKEADAAISSMHVATLAHELCHVLQFRNGQYPRFWLSNLGFLPNWKDERIVEAAENEADDWAKAYLVKRRIRIPEDFDRKRRDKC